MAHTLTKKQRENFSWFKSYRYRLNIMDDMGDVVSHLCFGLPDIRDKYGIPSTTVNRYLNGQRSKKHTHVISIEKVKIPAFKLVAVNPIGG